MAKDGLSSEGLHLGATERRWIRGAKQRQSRQQWAERELEKVRAARIAKETAPAPKPKKFKSKNARPKGKGKSSGPSTEVNKLVPKEAQRHGDYRLSDFKLQEVTEGGKRKDKTIRVVRNFARTPVERWHQRGKLDDRQMQAILFYQARWRMAFGEKRVTANYSPAISRNAQEAVEPFTVSIIDALRDLQMLDREVFKRRPKDFDVWQNIVLHDEPAGVAGGRLGFCHKPAEAVALHIVRSLADEVASLVIDRRARKA